MVLRHCHCILLMTLRRTSEVVVVGGFLYDTRDVRPFIPSSCKAVQSFHAHAQQASTLLTYFVRGYIVGTLEAW